MISKLNISKKQYCSEQEISFKERGNAILELVLFVPLALFFLFVAIDAGLSLIQRAGVQDAFRSGINSLPVYARQHGLTAAMVDSVAEEISSNLANQFSLYPDSSNNFYVNVSMYEVEIDTNTGALNSFSIVANKEIGGLSQSNTIKSFADKNDFISQRLVTTSTLSKYAEPAAFVNFSNSNSRQVYQENSHVLYAEVRAIPVGVNSSYLTSALGGLYSIQVQELELIRDY